MELSEFMRRAAKFCRPPAISDSMSAKSTNTATWGLKATLKGHQVEGVSWLIERFDKGVNVILGDEMGLGKTLQAIALLAYLRTELKSSGPFLVLCPLSVSQNWASEFERFAPSLRVLRYTGDAAQREDTRKQICEHVNSLPGPQRGDPELPFHVLLTTYELALLDAPFLARFRWRYAVVDEAQRLKNSSSVLYNVLLERYMIPRRLLMTGTPVQNNLAELWALLHFCMPRMFRRLADFEAMFGTAGSRAGEGNGTLRPGGGLALLHNLLQGLMLRRTKVALVKAQALELPPLTEATLMVPLAPLQRQLYLAILKKDLPRLLANHSGAPLSSLQNIVVQLRKACSHPYLFHGVEPEPFQEGEHLVQASSKLLLLDALLARLRPAGHRVLLFAQYSRTLDILQDYLELRRYTYERLDGSVRAEERFAAVRSFSRESAAGAGGGGEGGQGGAPFVFLLTTRAGGVGLNLTAADTVVFFEQDWNPQADRQALQRAHRMGQRRPVLALSLLCAHSVEEVIMKRACQKLRLTQDVIGRDDTDEDQATPAGASASDLRSMVLFGLHRLGGGESEWGGGTPGGAEEGGQVPARSNMLKEDEVAALVEKALLQRGGGAGAEAQDAALDAGEGVAAGHVYKYEGRDWQGQEGPLEGEEGRAGEEDEQVLASWLTGHPERGKGRAIGAGEKRGRGRERDLEAEAEAREAKRKRGEERQQAKWAAMGYTSLSVDEPDEGQLEAGWAQAAEGLAGDGRAGRGGQEEEAPAGRAAPEGGGGLEADLHFCMGDSTKPSQKQGEGAITLSCVDTSGVWGHGGMFSALEALSPKVAKSYERAHEAGDLRLGDLHLVPLSGSESASASVSSGSVDSHGVTYGAKWVALAVVQDYNHRRKIARSDIHADALETALQKAAMAAIWLHASVHMPRIGAKPGQGRNEWYATERLLRKCLSRHGVPTYVYYYRRPSQAMHLHGP